MQTLNQAYTFLETLPGDHEPGPVLEAITVIAAELIRTRRQIQHMCDESDVCVACEQDEDDIKNPVGGRAAEGR